MGLVKGQKGRKVSEHLIPNAVTRVFALLNFVDNVMRYFSVFSAEKKDELLKKDLYL